MIGQVYLKINPALPNHSSYAKIKSVMKFCSLGVRI